MLTAGCERLCHQNMTTNIPVGNLKPIVLESQLYNILKPKNDHRAVHSSILHPQQPTGARTSVLGYAETISEQMVTDSKLESSPKPQVSKTLTTKETLNSTVALHIEVDDLTDQNSEKPRPSLTKAGTAANHRIADTALVGIKSWRKPNITLSGGKDCDACLMGKQLITVHKGKYGRSRMC